MPFCGIPHFLSVTSGYEGLLDDDVEMGDESTQFRLGEYGFLQPAGLWIDDEVVGCGEIGFLQYGIKEFGTVEIAVVKYGRGEIGGHERGVGQAAVAEDGFAQTEPGPDTIVEIAILQRKIAGESVEFRQNGTDHLAAREESVAYFTRQFRQREVALFEAAFIKIGCDNRFSEVAIHKAATTVTVVRHGCRKVAILKNLIFCHFRGILDLKIEKSSEVGKLRSEINGYCHLVLPVAISAKSVIQSVFCLHGNSRYLRTL